MRFHFPSLSSVSSAPVDILDWNWALPTILSFAALGPPDQSIFYFYFYFRKRTFDTWCARIPYLILTALLFCFCFCCCFCSVGDCIPLRAPGGDKIWASHGLDYLRGLREDHVRGMRRFVCNLFLPLQRAVSQTWKQGSKGGK